MVSFSTPWTTPGRVFDAVATAQFLWEHSETGGRVEFPVGLHQEAQDMILAITARPVKTREDRRKVAISKAVEMSGSVKSSKKATNESQHSKKKQYHLCSAPNIDTSLPQTQSGSRAAPHRSRP